MPNELIRSLVKFTLIASILAYTSNIQAENTQEDSVRASLTANFIRFTTWPTLSKSSQNEAIHLCTVGDSALAEAFLDLNNKSINDKPIEVSHLTRFNTLENCQLLYFSDIDKYKRHLILNEIKDMPILTIGEDELFVKTGGMISVEIIEGKVKISINLKATKKSNLTISARVLKLATIIE